MATKKISELDTVPSVDGTETFPVLKSGYNYKMTVSQVVAWISLATTSVAGLLSSSDKSKLDSVQTGATANATNAELRNRATHTGTQPAATITGLATVATSNDYGDLDNLPSLATVATSGAYSDLTGAPSLATVATSGAYSDLTGAPSLATVATTGAYSDLTGKPSLATVATSGAYSDLTGKPTLDTDWQTWQHLPLTAFASAAGTTAGTATAITKAVTQVSTASSGQTGLIIPSSMTLGAAFTIINATTTALNLYPPTGGQINYAGANVPLSVSSYNTVRVILIDVANGIYQQM